MPVHEQVCGISFQFNKVLNIIILGESATSPMLNILTDCGNPSVVRNVRVEDVRSNGMTYTWDAPEYNVVSGTSYKVCHWYNLSGIFVYMDLYLIGRMVSQRFVSWTTFLPKLLDFTASDTLAWSFYLTMI